MSKRRFHQEIGEEKTEMSELFKETWEFFEKTWEILGKTWEKILEISDVLFLARERWRSGDDSGKRKIATSVSSYHTLTRTLFVERRKMKRQLPSRKNTLCDSTLTRVVKTIFSC